MKYDKSLLIYKYTVYTRIGGMPNAIGISLSVRDVELD